MILFCVKDISLRTFKSIFKGKQDKLEEKIDTDGLLSKLEAEEVITKRHRSTIEVSFVAVDKLLKLILALFVLSDRTIKPNLLQTEMSTQII